jgi:hypothetical protein
LSHIRFGGCCHFPLLQQTCCESSEFAPPYSVGCHFPLLDQQATLFQQACCAVSHRNLLRHILEAHRSIILSVGNWSVCRGLINMVPSQWDTEIFNFIIETSYWDCALAGAEIAIRQKWKILRWLVRELPDFNFCRINHGCCFRLFRICDQFVVRLRLGKEISMSIVPISWKEILLKLRGSVIAYTLPTHFWTWTSDPLLFWVQVWESSGLGAISNCEWFWTVTELKKYWPPVLDYKHDLWLVNTEFPTCLSPTNFGRGIRVFWEF